MGECLYAFSVSFSPLTFLLCFPLAVTSSSVFVNLPAAALLIVMLRYLSLDVDARIKAAIYKSKLSSLNSTIQKKQLDGPRTVNEKSDWRKKVDSPVVEDAIDHFTRHIVSEWVTDLWYCRITSDRQGPEELVQIMNGVLGEISCRMRSINLIDLLTRFQNCSYRMLLTYFLFSLCYIISSRKSFIGIMQGYCQSNMHSFGTVPYMQIED